MRGGDVGGHWYLGAPKPRGNEDLTLAHLLVVGAAAPASVDLLYEGGQLLDSKASLLLQEEKLWSGERGNREAGLGEQRALSSCTRSTRGFPASVLFDHSFVL